MCSLSSLQSQATKYGGGYPQPYYNNYNYRPRPPYYNHYNYHYKQNVGPGPACGNDPWNLPNCRGKSTLNLDTCQCECPVPSEFCSKGYHYSQVYCECLPNGPPPPPVFPPPRPLPPSRPLPPPFPPARPQCPPCRSTFAVLDLTDCSCDCPASAQRYCVYNQVLDPDTCRCYCPANAADRCLSHETLDRDTCRCRNPGPGPNSCSTANVRCNNLQVFDPIDCRCECEQVIVTVTETLPGERPGTPQVIERTGTTRTPGGRPGTRSGTSRGRRGAGVHLIKKRRKSKSRSPGTRTFTTVPGTPGRPGEVIETRRRIPAPCPNGQIEDSNCECLRL